MTLADAMPVLRALHQRAMTAAELAAELGWTTRRAERAIAALRAAGVPLQAAEGPAPSRGFPPTSWRLTARAWAAWLTGGG